MELIFLSKKGKKKVAIDLNGNEIRDIGEIFQVSETYKKYNTYFIITPEKLFAYNYKHKKLKLLAYHKIDLELLDCFFTKFLFKARWDIAWIRCGDELKFFDGYGDPIALEGYKTAYYYSYLDGVYISKSDNEDAFSNSKIELFDPITKTIKEVISGQFLEKNLVAVKNLENENFFGVSDLEGNIKVPSKYLDVSMICDTIVKLRNEKCQNEYFDLANNKPIFTDYFYISKIIVQTDIEQDIYNGEIFYYEKNNKIGLIDHQENIKLEANYFSFNYLAFGLFAFSRSEKNPYDFYQPKFGLCDTEGNVLLEEEYDEISISFYDYDDIATIKAVSTELINGEEFEIKTFALKDHTVIHNDEIDNIWMVDKDKFIIQKEGKYTLKSGWDDDAKIFIEASDNLYVCNGIFSHSLANGKYRLYRNDFIVTIECDNYKFIYDEKIVIKKNNYLSLVDKNFNVIKNNFYNAKDIFLINNGF